MTVRRPRVLVVCFGNTCRSPLAAALLAARLASTSELAAVIVESAGTGALDGAPASPGSATVARERGLDLSAHRARLLTTQLVEDADVILTMGRTHLNHVVALGGASKVHLLTAYAGDAEVDVADPYGRELSAYRETAQQFEQVLDSVVLRLRRELSE